jgi:hypothetical protein
MKKLFSTRCGSYLYGSATPSSDVDLKHIVLPSLNDLLIGKQVKNIVKKTNKQAFTKNSAEDIDEEFIPIQILARDFLGGQTYSLELAYAVEYTAAHQKIHDPLILGFCRELRSQFLTSNMSALIGYSVNQASLYSFKGERLNAVRAVKNMLETFIAISSADTKPMDCKANFEISAREVAAQFPKYFQVTTYAVDNNGTMKPCIKLLEKVLPYTSTFETSLGVINAQLKKYGSRADAASIDNVDWKSTMHAIRVVDEGISLLKTKSLRFPFEKDYVDFLLSIKHGELEYNHVIDCINIRLDELKRLEEDSHLPKKTPELTEMMERWLAEWMRIFYTIPQE